MKSKTIDTKVFNKAKVIASKRELSPFAKFHIALKGYDLLRRGMPIFKFEAWWMGFRNADYILSGEGIIKAVKKVELN